VNSAQTAFRSEWSERQHVDLIGEAVSRALKGTGLRIDDVDFVIDSGSDFLDGRSISNCGFLGAMGAHHKEESRVEEDGLWALGYASNKIASGAASIGLVIAYSKPSEGNIDDYWNGLLEPFVQRPVGLDQYVAAGLVARRYLAASGLDAVDLREISEQSWRNAARNPYIETQRPADDDPYWHDEVATPLRRSDLALPVDGAVAVLVSRAEVADQITSTPVWLTGQGSAIDQHFLAAREQDSLPAAGFAARAAYRMSGDTKATDYDLVEVSARSTVGELMVLEALGLAEKHKGIELYRSSASFELNPSGGALPADPIMATGLARVHEAASRLARRTGYEDSQARRALVHGTGGFAMQNHCVVTMEVDS
jgi:acetyl-CoA C-acetyltransferase